ncbi:MAG: alcohol dehydrogenase catalytic domain-containing protein, partial [Deltaproteobacteria bacterium]|nr:alcohol dehydrogenase catalytic domain-containing protein [Deltaproteobacteria bacterium]
MRCIKIHGPGDVRFEEIDQPIPGAKDVLVKVSHCGICGTDLGYIKAGGLMGPMPDPMALGHEVSGVVEAVGEEVVSIQPGMRVVANPMGANNLIGNGGPEGAFADFVLVRNATNGGCLYEIPAEISMQEAALTEPQLEVFETMMQDDQGSKKRMFLPTSPEFSMKKMLCAGSGSIF